MIGLLSSIAKYEYQVQNNFSPKAQLAYYDSVINTTYSTSEMLSAKYCKTSALLQLGDEQQSASMLEELLTFINPADISHVRLMKKDLAIAYLRVGERSNCIYNHASQSRLFQ